MSFKIVKKGYDTKEVDVHVRNLTENYEQSLASQRERIDEMRSQLSVYEDTVKNYKEKSGLVTRAIYNAVAKAEEIEKLSKLKYFQEIEQLKAFHEKWMGYYNRILEKYPLDDDLMAADKFNRQMQNILAKTNSNKALEELQSQESALEKNFQEETQRLKEKQIGYIKVQTKQKSTENDEDLLQKIVPGADVNSPIMSGDFDPIERINRYFAAERNKESKSGAVTKDSRKITKTSNSKDYKDRSESGYSIEEALNPTQELADIMKDLGLLLDE